MLLASALWLGACQPSPDERLQNAEAYFANAEYRSAIIELKNVLQAQPDRVPARVMLAEASYILNDLESAESEYRKVLSLTDGDASSWVGYGRSLLLQGKAEEALERVAGDLESYPESAPAAAVLGDIYRALGNLSLAEEHYRRAVTIEPNSEAGLVGIAFCAAGEGRLVEANELLDTALVLLPDSAYVLRAKGDVLSAAQQFSAAAAIYDRAIDAESATTPFADRYLVRQNRVAALVEARQLDEASERLEQFSEMVPGHPQMTFLSGRIAFARGDYEIAEDQILEYLNSAPNDARGQAILGAINFSKNNLGQAEQYLSNAVRANIGGETMRLLLAETQLRLDRPQDAMQSLGNVAGDEQQDAVTLAMLGRVRLGSGDTDAAIDYFRRSLEQDGSSKSVNLALASSYMSAGNLAEATDTLLRMAPATDNDYRREMLLMAVYLKRDMAADAEAVAKSLLRQHPDDADAHALVGVLYSNLGQHTRARAQLDTALGLDPGNAGALYALGVSASADGRPADAASHFGDLLDTRPAHLQALIQLAAVLESVGNLTAIRPRLAAAEAATPDINRLRKLSARIELMLGDTDAAIASIEQGRQSFPNDAGFLHLDGIARLQSGDLEAAVASLSRAARAEPENAAYQFELARAQLANRNFAEAIGVARVYRELRPADVRGLAIEVDAQVRSGDPLEARRTVTAFAERYPEEGFVRMLFGDIARAAGDAANAAEWYAQYSQDNWNRVVALRLAEAQQAAGSDKSVETVERWLAQAPDDSGMRRFYAQLLEAGGNAQRAVLEYERLAAAGNLDAIGMNNLAWQYMQLGREGASELAERAHSMRPDNGSITDTWGWILFKEGNVNRAVEVLRQAAQQAPTNPEIRYHLAAALAETGEHGEARRIVNELLASGAAFPSRSEAELLLESF